MMYHDTKHKSFFFVSIYWMRFSNLLSHLLSFTPLSLSFFFFLLSSLLPKTPTTFFRGILACVKLPRPLPTPQHNNQIRYKSVRLLQDFIVIFRFFFFFSVLRRFFLFCFFLFCWEQRWFWGEWLVPSQCVDDVVGIVVIVVGLSFFVCVFSCSFFDFLFVGQSFFGINNNQFLLFSLSSFFVIYLFAWKIENQSFQNSLRCR